MSDLKQSRDLYIAAFERALDDYYTGINAAAKSVLLRTQSGAVMASLRGRATALEEGVETRLGGRPTPFAFAPSANLGAAAHTSGRIEFLPGGGAADGDAQRESRCRAA